MVTGREATPCRFCVSGLAHPADGSHEPIDSPEPGRQTTCPDCRTALRGTTKGGCKHPFHNPDQPHFRETTPARETP